MKSLNLNALLLPNLSWLSNINTVTEDLLLSNMTELTSLSGLENVVTVGGKLSLTYLPLVTNLDALQNITSIGTLRIVSNPGLTSLPTLQYVTSLAGGLEITDNALLPNLNGLDNLTTIGQRLEVYSNPLLTSLSGLEKLTTIHGQLGIGNNALLPNLNGLQNLALLDGHLRVSENLVLNSLSALSNTTFACRAFWISYNPLLTNFSGLENITSVDSLNIVYNQSLTSLSALGNLTAVEDWLFINGNTSLSNCSIFPICVQVLNGQTTNFYIAGNAPGCNTPEEAATMCISRPVTVFVLWDNNGINVPIGNLPVKLSGASQMNLKPTDANGMVGFAYVDIGSFSLSLPTVSSDKWQRSESTILLSSSTGQDSTVVTLLLTPLGQCPELTVNLAMPSFFRGCLTTSDLEVSTQNTGTVIAEGLKVAVVLPPVLELLASAPPLDAQSGDTLYFDLGDLLPFGKSNIMLTVKTKCDTFLLGQTHMTKLMPRWTMPNHGRVIFSDQISGKMYRRQHRAFHDKKRRGCSDTRLARVHHHSQ